MDSEEIPCPSCGTLVELFSDEPVRRCRCGQAVTRATLPTCADWCPSAPECFGGEMDAEEHRKRVAKLKDDPRAKDYVQGICRRLRQKYGSSVGSE